MKILLPPLIFPSDEVIKIPLQSHLRSSLGCHHDFPPSVTSRLPFFRSVPNDYFFSLCFADRTNHENVFFYVRRTRNRQTFHVF